MKLISIIVPCYNQGCYLSEALNSVLCQSYPYWECIIVNDGSTDNTESIANEYIKKDNRFKYYYQDNKGLATTRNNGILFSKGEFILPLDADDIIGEKYLEKALNVFSQNPNTKLVYCNAKRFGVINEKWDLEPYCYDRLLWSNMIFCSAVYKRSDYNQTNGYNPNMAFGYEDWDFWLSLLHPDDIVYRIEDILFFYRQKSVSMLKTAGEHHKDLLVQLYHNHKEKYSSYVENIIVLHQESQLLRHISSSREYRIGKMITKRFPLISKIIIAIGNKRIKAKKQC